MDWSHSAAGCIKGAFPQKRLSNRFYRGTGALSLFAVLACSGYANLRILTLVSVHRDFFPLLGCSGTVFRFFFNRNYHSR